LDSCEAAKNDIDVNEDMVSVALCLTQKHSKPAFFNPSLVLLGSGSSHAPIDQEHAVLLFLKQHKAPHWLVKWNAVCE